MGTRSPAIHKVLVNPFLGFLFSILLGFGLGSVAGAGVGIGVAVGNMLGLATNEVTFNFFTSCAKWNARRKVIQTNVKARSTQYREFYDKNKRLCDEAIGTIKGGIMTIGAIIGFVLFVIGIPHRLYTKYRAWRGAAYDVA